MINGLIGALLRSPGAALGLLGHYGTQAVALSAVLGLLLPTFSAILRPWLPVAIFLLLTLAFLRVEPAAIARRLSRPVVLLLAVVWIMGFVPLASGLGAQAAGLEAAAPGVMLALFMVTAAPPVMSAPAFAFLMGLDGALSLAVMVTCLMVTPLLAPLIAGLLLETALPIDAATLAWRLGALLAGSYLVAWLIRTLAGRERLRRHYGKIDGLNVLLLFAFIVAAMDGVAHRFLSDPVLVLGIAVLSFVVALVQIGLTMLAFVRLGRADGFVLALAAGNRNMGLMVAALGGTLPELAWLYFALGQLPIYLLPLLLKPFAQRLQQPAIAPSDKL